MSKIFKITKDPHDTGEMLYKKTQITIKPGVTVLVGCNGCGKTTLLRTMHEKLKKDTVPVMFYDNLRDGGSNAKSRAGFYNDIPMLATLMCSSEGEQINLNLCAAARNIGSFVRKNKGAPEMFFLFDAIDSGLSIDNIEETKELLFDTIIEDNPNSNVYIIVSANEYEMCREEKCFDVRNGKYITFENYEEYRSFILNSRKEKDERCKKKN